MEKSGERSLPADNRKQAAVLPISENEKTGGTAAKAACVTGGSWSYHRERVYMGRAGIPK